MQIECPHCSAKLQLGSPKPGLYKPNCKKCGEPFLVQVSADQPPRLRVAKEETQRLAKPDRPPVAKTASSNAQVMSSGSAPTRDLSPAPGGGRPAPPSSNSKSELQAPPARLGGYRIVRMLGRGAMGSVYHAKQISLDRDVALKTIRGRLADSPTSLARFTREAYAAAQLSHHNVVQIYDFGEDEGQHFFSMEWVRGGSLAELVREKGSIDPKLAATYILQAARGLQFAHRCGMVHRDVKPANLLLGDDGVVKIADLGLVKVPDEVDSEPAYSGGTVESVQSGTQVTMQGTAVGTPAYMAPEQSADASTVDHRADIYSLGCSLFYLLIGRAPYEGESVSEMMKQHAETPLPDLGDLNARVPQTLTKIASTAMAKRPDDRYGSLAGMIADLESFLGIESSGGFSPTSDQADRWESIASRYNKTQLLTRFSGIATYGLAALSLVLAVTTILLAFSSEDPLATLRWLPLGPIVFVIGCGTALGLAATLGNSAVVASARRLAGSMSWLEIGLGVSCVFVLVAGLLLGGFWLSATLGTLFGIAAGAGFHFAMHQSAAGAGRESLAEAKTFVRDLRIGGADETGLRDFLARYAGQGWQSIFEALFGFDAMTEMRARLAGDPTFNGPTQSGGLRERACNWMQRRVDRKRQADERAKLARIERSALVSQGVSASEANERSWQMASALMDVAGQPLSESSRDERRASELKRQRIKAMLAEARSGKYDTAKFHQPVWQLALSGYTRMLIGMLLLAAFVFLLQQSGLVTDEMVEGVRRGNLDQIDLSALPGDATTKALGKSTSLWSVGIAGVLMCFSAFVSGWRMTPFALVATVVILGGASFGIPSFPPLAAWMVAALAGLVVYLPGIVFGEDRRRTV